jgi:cell division protease FtsH
MSEKVGFLAVLTDDEVPSDSDTFAVRTHELVDEEARRLIDDAQSDVRALLREERTRLDSLAAALLERETLDEVEAYAVADVSRGRDVARA